MGAGPPPRPGGRRSDRGRFGAILFRPENGAGRLAAVADLVDDHGCGGASAPRPTMGRRPARRRPGAAAPIEVVFAQSCLDRRTARWAALAGAVGGVVGPQADDGRRAHPSAAWGRRSDRGRFRAILLDPRTVLSAWPRSTAAARRRSQMTAGGRLG